MADACAGDHLTISFHQGLRANEGYAMVLQAELIGLEAVYVGKPACLLKKWFRTLKKTAKHCL